MPEGRDPGQKGAKRGYVGGISPDTSRIQDDVFSKDWASPLNADNPGQPGPSPRQGGVLETDKDMGSMPPNPLGIPNVSSGKGKK